MYLVMMVKTEHKVSLLGREVPIKMEWADGMIGVVPVFKTKKDAVKYAGKKIEIIEAKEVENGQV